MPFMDRVKQVAGAPFRWIGRRAFGFLCDRCFDKADADKSGYIEAIELEVTVLYLYNMVNKRLPGWEDPPTRDEIHAAMAAFDTDSNKKFDKQEFREFVKSLMHTGPDAFFARVGKNMVSNSAILPGAALAVKKASGPALSNVPLAVIAPLLGTITKSVRSLMPF
uniref:EF-hand domain-containing protein n=1 Tax=Chlamydomonas euryale TaxID=1486919 RepID=A0A7R9VSR9_9CHLO|mmetsp:Transcript_43543/g.130587  ORF Transcript_43543/g.130587 Transcript_43543/m.130587 type:complete len:165 (+) Transcript_43543:40-534(+)